MKQPWIHSARYDGLLILAPPFLSLLLVLLLPTPYRTTAHMPLLGWVTLVLLVDVAHVYSTLFRTYLDPQRRRQRWRLFGVVPVVCYAAGVALHSVSGLLFWRVLAYVAVFHFIRQQYGFLRLYARHEAPSAGRWLDVAVVYYATLYPLVYWHLSSPRNFNWFVDGDFVQYDWPLGRHVAMAGYALLLLLYVAKEAQHWQHDRAFNLPRNLLLLGTLVSWYFGIVYFNGDLAFTLLNVISHGIPYLALVWATSRPPAGARATARGPRKARYGLLAFLGLIIGLAYLEEGFWDGLVWREHTAVFGWFQQLPQLTDSPWLAWVVPLLALPQATHYVLDGFIWRREKRSDEPLPVPQPPVAVLARR